MARELNTTFITELPLVVSHAQDVVMIGRFEAGRRLFNATLGDGLKALDLMCESKIWAAAQSMPKGELKGDVRKARNAAFKACN